MTENSKAVVEKLIKIMEERETFIRESMKKKDKPDKNPFMPGWAKGVFLSWEHSMAYPEYDTKEHNKITCFFEFNGIIVSERRMEENTNIDLKFLTSEHFKNEIVPALREWAQNKVDNEVFGGLYGANFCITITLSTHREVRPTDPPHMKGCTWEQAYIKVKDEKRLETRKKMIYDFINNKEYLKANIEDISNSLSDISYHAVHDFFNEFGSEKLKEFFTTLIEKAKQTRFNSSMSRLVYGFANGVSALLESSENHTPTEEEMSFACWLCMMTLLNGTDKYERQYGRDYLKQAGELGSKEAKKILKFGTGQLPEDVVQYKDKFVTCVANDIDKVIDLKIKEENEEAYRSMLNFIIRLMDAGFPSEYSMKFNSKIKEYLPISDLKKTKASNFWNNCSKYPALFPLMKEYVRNNMDSYDYYNDAWDEQAVSLGGYATFALGLADISNCDIVEEFMRQNDSEHTISSSWFVGEFIDKYGVTLETIPAVITCICNSNSSEYRGNNFDGLKNPANLEAFVEAIEEMELEGYVVEEIASYIWGDEEEMTELINESDSILKANLQKIWDKAFNEEYDE